MPRVLNPFSSRHRIGPTSLLQPNKKNELQYLRIKTKKHEVIVAVDDDYLVTVLQRWAPSSSSP